MNQKKFEIFQSYVTSANLFFLIHIKYVMSNYKESEYKIVIAIISKLCENICKLRKNIHM